MDVRFAYVSGVFMVNRKFVVTYYLQRRVVVGVDSNGNEIIDWIDVMESTRDFNFVVNGSSWRQVRSTVLIGEGR